MAKIKHFIITQFNLRLWDKDKFNKAITEEWLENRFILFEKYCLPSVLNQTGKDFIWLCLLDENTPKKYVEKINRYQKDCSQISACYLSKEETKEWLNYTKEVIKKNLTEEIDYIITTNLDNDDAIRSSMVETIHNKVQNETFQEKEILYSFNIGYQYFIDLGILLKMSYPHNHFLSLIEKNTPDFQTIKRLPHAKARKHFKTVDIKGEPYWIEFVHTKNVNNDLRITSRIKYYPIFKSISLKDFGVNINITALKNTFNFFVKMPPLFIKTAIRKLSKKLKR